MSRRSTWARTSLIAVALLAASACSAPEASTRPAAPAPGTPAAPASEPVASPAGPDLAVADSPLGSIVVDRTGRTTYYFDKDEAGSGRSVCTGECLQAWPPVTPAGSTARAEGLSAEVGVITRDDGTRQVTVAGRPVYLFAKDAAPGDVTGQGVARSGT